MREDKLYNDTTSLFQPVEEEEDIDLDFDSNNNLEEFKGNILMPTSTRRLSLLTAKKPATRCSTCKADANNLTRSMGKMTINTPYNFEKQSIYIQKSFTKSKKYFAEVEFMVMPLDADRFWIIGTT